MTFRDFFYIRKSDRSALLVVLAVVLVAVGLIYWVGREDNLKASSDFIGQEQTNDLQEQNAASQLSQGSGASSYYAVPEQQAERFEFDPNTADSTQLLRLGLQPWQVRSIYRYRSKGGVFREASDFARLYGLTQKQYRELLPYIRISSDYRPAAELVGPRGKNGYEALSPAPREGGGEEIDSRIGYPEKLKAGEHVVLNLADTTALKQVPGIGSYFARRIVAYGQQLGGYTSAEQLLEIEGFPEEALPYFQVNTGEIRKLNLNTLSLSKLRQHPYLNFYQARAINDYRRLKGPLSSLDDLRLLPEFPPRAIERLRPYVEF